MSNLSEKTVARFWAKVKKTETCWLWTACVSRRYGLFMLNGRPVKAHRVAYEMCVGPIPHGLEIDHVRSRGCHGGACVNPAHLEPVTHAENVRRGRAAEVNVSRRGTKTHCPKGHEYTAANSAPRTVNGKSGYKKCRACIREKSILYNQVVTMRKRTARLKGSAGEAQAPPP